MHSSGEAFCVTNIFFNKFGIVGLLETWILPNRLCRSMAQLISILLQSEGSRKVFWTKKLGGQEAMTSGGGLFPLNQMTEILLQVGKRTFASCCNAVT